MKILIDFSALRRTHWREHLTRFLLGGVATVITGVIAKVFGPAVGGLFLAFPAIFPASATLLDKHERKKKRNAGIAVTMRGSLAVGLDARGAALGSIALGGFALILWKALPHYPSAAVLGAALAMWMATAAGLWRVRKLHVYFSRRQGLRRSR